ACREQPRASGSRQGSDRVGWQQRTAAEASRETRRATDRPQRPLPVRQRQEIQAMSRHQRIRANRVAFRIDYGVNWKMIDISVKQDLREMAKRLQELRGSL